jgi:hypothetical protein
MLRTGGESSFVAEKSLKRLMVKPLSVVGGRDTHDSNGKAEPRRRVCGITILNKLTNKPKKPRYNERRRRCRLQRVLARLLKTRDNFLVKELLSVSLLEKLDD